MNSEEKKKKVGIVTYVDFNAGKGRYMQALALYKCIQSLGYDVEIIDYYPWVLKSETSKIKRFLKSFSDKRVLIGYMETCIEKVNDLLTIKQKYEQRMAYEFYSKKHMTTTPKIMSIDEIKEWEDRYDAYVCGSDQIWNPFYWGKDPVYYLSFTSDRKKISYAASIGTTQIPAEVLKMMGEHIQKIKYLSVREKSAMLMLRQKLGINAYCVLDPALTISPQYWHTLAENHINSLPLQKPYLLEVFFDRSRFPRKISKKTAKRKKLTAVAIPDTLYDTMHAKEKIWPKGPAEFLEVIRYAKFVCTQSFHVVIFCLIFHVPFYVFPRLEEVNADGLLSRIKDLLELVNLSDRIIAADEDIEKCRDTINFEHIDVILETEREKAMDFLEESLEYATKEF